MKNFFWGGQTYQNRVNFGLAVEEHSFVSTKTSRTAVLPAVGAVGKIIIIIIIMYLSCSWATC